MWWISCVDMNYAKALEKNWGSLSMKIIWEVNIVKIFAGVLIYNLYGLGRNLEDEWVFTKCIADA